MQSAACVCEKNIFIFFRSNPIFFFFLTCPGSTGNMQGSVIKAEITEQVRLLKEEWRVTVEKMSKAMAEVRSTLVHAILSLTISAPLPYFFHTRILTGATFWLQNVAHGIERGSLAPCFATCLHLSELCSSVFQPCTHATDSFTLCR